MYIDTEGIILKQNRTADNRRIAVLLSRKYGKISAGSSISEKSRNKSSLALKPFTYGKYELFKGRDTYHINGAEVIRSYFAIGENVDKYMSCSYILEFTEKILPENMAAPEIFDLLKDFLDIMERRPREFLLLVTAYQIKALQLCGQSPNLENCAVCGKASDRYLFSVEAGGLVCDCCIKNAKTSAVNKDSLIYAIDFGIVNIMKYIMNNRLTALEKLTLDEGSLIRIQSILKSYIYFHLDIKDLKSEAFLSDH